MPPPDNPLRRHEELDVDRRLVGESPPARAATSARRTPGGRKKDKAGRVRATTTDSDMMVLCKHRLAALDRRAKLPAAAALDPVVAPAGTAAAPVAPVPGGRNWVQLGPTAIPKGQTYSSVRVLVTGRVTSIVVDPVDPNIVYIGAAQGGVWKTEDGGLNWIPKSDHEISLAIGALAMDPSDRLTLYAGTGEGNFSGDSYYGNGVLKTTDGGQTWTLQGQATFTGSRFSRLAVTPGTPARVFAAVSGDNTFGIYRSINGGVAWTRMSGGLPANADATDVCIDPMTPTTAYAAFWGAGVFKTTNAGAANPTWTRLAGGFPTAGFTRIALGVAPSSPATLYALLAGPGNASSVNRFLRSTDGGATWTPIPLPGGNIGGQGFYNLNVAVDPTTPDIVYLSGISVWKATRNAMTGAWSIGEVGSTIHPDNHAFAFEPTNHLVVYAGSDGGIYRSADGGQTWSDTINEGPCITQFEFIDDHPTSGAVVIGGTQDNGTEQYRNSPVFHHADDGDGGFCAVDRNQPNTVLSTYYGPSPKLSTEGGEFDTWYDVSTGLVGNSLFYAPMALDETNPSNVAFGTDRINLDNDHGSGQWTTRVSLPGMTGLVSAIQYVNSSLIYVGTDGGQIYRLDRVGSHWSARALHAAGLPEQHVWDVRARPDDDDTIVVGMSGFGSPHVWRGVVGPGGGPATWTEVSGTGTGRLPDIPVNALVIDPAALDTWYVGTDVGVFRTTDGGTTWAQFSDGLPNCAVFDLRLHDASRVLRAATHGRGLWEIPLDGDGGQDVDLFVRNNLMDTARAWPAPSNVEAAFSDPLRHVALGDKLWWWQCADLKVDVPAGAVPGYQMPVANVDYVAFESKLVDRGTRAGAVNRIYVQLHNRGTKPALGVTVKLLYASASAGVPPLPPDFWTAFPGDGSPATGWHAIGSATVLPSLSPREPAVVEWDWTTPTTLSEATCLLAVVDSPSDPIPPASRIFDVAALVQNEKRVGLRSLHPIAVVPGTSISLLVEFPRTSGRRQAIRLLPAKAEGWRVIFMFPKSAKVVEAVAKAKTAPAAPAQVFGVTARKPAKALLTACAKQLGSAIAAFDTTRVVAVDAPAKGALLPPVTIPKSGLRALVTFKVPASAKSPATFSIVQEEAGKVVTGTTYVLTVPDVAGG